MSEMTQKLQAYGADLAGAMERFLEDEELYADCLEAFAEDEAFAALGNALAQQNYADAFDHAHTLKGVAGNLGLTPLFQALCTLVEPLRMKDYSNIAQQYAAVEAAHQALKALL